MTEQERVEKDWTEYLTNNPHDVIPMLAGLLSIMGMERIDENEEATTPDTPSQSDQASECSVPSTSVDGGGNE